MASAPALHPAHAASAQARTRSVEGELLKSPTTGAVIDAGSLRDARHVRVRRGRGASLDRMPEELQQATGGRGRRS
jgi:hypothetical protein